MEIYAAIEGYDDRDWEEEFIGGKSIKEAKCFSNIKYNQKLVSSYSCTGAASIGTISDVTGFALPLSFRKKVWENQLKTGAKEGFGDTILNGVKQSVNLFNEEFPELPYKLTYYRISNIKKTVDLFSILKYSSVVTGYSGSLRGDAEDNGVIDNIDNVDGSGHCIRIVKAWLEGRTVKIKYCDNYEGVNKYNIITVDDFLNNKDFFTGGYYIKKEPKD